MTGEQKVDTTGTGTLARVGVGGTINGYDVRTAGDVQIDERHGEEVARTQVKGLGRFIANARTLSLGWDRFPDGAEVNYLYDRGDGCFGYAINLEWPDSSARGTRPLRHRCPSDPLSVPAVGVAPATFGARLGRCTAD